MQHKVTTNIHHIVDRYVQIRASAIFRTIFSFYHVPLRLSIHSVSTPSVLLHLLCPCRCLLCVSDAGTEGVCVVGLIGQYLILGGAYAHQAQHTVAENAMDSHKFEAASDGSTAGKAEGEGSERRDKGTVVALEVPAIVADSRRW